MAAKNHLNPRQLKLFMTAGELMEHPAGDFDGRSMFDEDDGAAGKLYESKIGSKKSTHGYRAESGEETLYKSIKREGVLKPVNLTFANDDDEVPTIDDGHHRVAAAYDINPNMYIPVDYSSGWSGWSFSGKGNK